MSELETAIAIAVEAHKGQMDKSDVPYILHPMRVMFGVSGEKAMSAAILHDVLEDTEITADDLRGRGISSEVIETVEFLTRADDEPYEAFIERAGLHPLAVKIKRSDLFDNMRLDRLKNFDEKAVSRLKKYHAALQRLDELEAMQGDLVHVDLFNNEGIVNALTVTLVPRALPFPHSLNAKGSAGTIIFRFVSLLSEAVSVADYPHVYAALKSRDIEVLHAIRPGWAPCYCPSCKDLYSIDQWAVRGGEDGAVFGTCPVGHERLLED